jgi:hypothetical protein
VPNDLEARSAHNLIVNTLMQNIAADPNVPTLAEMEEACTQAKDRFLVVRFLINSDKAQYGSLVQDVKNEYTRGTNTYPTTLSAAYDYIVNYQTDKTSNPI